MDLFTAFMLNQLGFPIFFKARGMLILIALVFIVLLKLIEVLTHCVKATISAVRRHAGTFVGIFAAVLLAIVVYNNGESTEVLKEAFDNLHG